jgi:hypothetical protein
MEACPYCGKMEVAACRIGGSADRRIEYPDMVRRKILEQHGQHLETDSRGNWFFRAMAYWTYRENQTLVIEVLADLKAILFRYDFEDTA